MDKLTKYLGTMMILVVLYVVFKSKPPVGEAVAGIASFDQAPDLVLPLITLLGGSCGGYIALLRSPQTSGRSYKGEKDLPKVRQSVLMGVGVSGTMRILLFLAVLA